MARLTHPNVVTVYETGVVHLGEELESATDEHAEGEPKVQVFIAMELLDAGSLEGWLREHPLGRRRDVSRIVATFVKAGRGLVAAHAADLVHRDFKPANVLLGRDGRVKVADFGLARHLSCESSLERSHEGVTSVSPGTGSDTAGTPAYMAPEQYDGHADARSDQFSFCVALWEALHGVRPYVAGSAPALVERMRSGPPDLPRSGLVPSWLRDVLLRGLSFQPGDRWPSMQALLEALMRDPWRRWRRSAAGGGLVALVGLGWWQPWRVDDPCGGPEETLEGVWDDAVREDVAREFAGISAPYAAQTWDRVEPMLDGYVSRWHGVRRERCDAILVRHEHTPAAFGLTMDCLAQRREALGVVTSMLRDVDTVLAEQAVHVVASLGSVEACGDTAALRATPRPEDPVVEPDVQAARMEIAAFHARLGAGAALKPAEVAPLVERARVLDQALLAEALDLEARVHEARGEHEPAEAKWGEGLREAAAAGHDALIARVWPELIGVATSRGEPARALAWELPARSAVIRAGSDPLQEAAIHHALGSAATDHSLLERAESEHLRGLALRREHAPDNRLLVAESTNHLARVYVLAGRNEEALELVMQSLEIHRDELGPDHPKVASLSHNAALVLTKLGRDRDALGLFSRALEIREATYGVEATSSIESLATLGFVQGRLGELDEGIARMERALQLAKRVHGDHPRVTSILNNLAALYDWADRIEDALEMHRQAVAILEDKADTQGPALAMNLSNMAYMQLLSGDLEAARPNYERAIEVYERSFGPEHPDLWRPLTQLARVHRLRGELESARPLAERAVILLSDREWSPIEVADAHLELAEIRWLAGERTAETRALVEHALELVQAVAERDSADQARAWLEKHPL